MPETKILVHGRNRLPPLAKISSKKHQVKILARMLMRNLQSNKPEHLRKQRRDVPRYRLSFKDQAKKEYEYLKIHDTANLYEQPWLENFRHHIHTDSFSMFGVCPACFHMRGPHYHYLAPIRVGGGYTIYHKMAVKPLGVGGKINWNTVKWLNKAPNKHKFKFDAEVRHMTNGDQFLVELFHEFVEHGGDTLALQEYLESNFDAKVLEEFRQTGVSVELIVNYTRILRQHVGEKIKSNVGAQRTLIQFQNREVFLATCFIEIEESGADLDMLFNLLTLGGNCSEILEFKKSGGNIELLEHSVDVLLERFEESGYVLNNVNQKELKDMIASELQKYIEHESEHRNANIFIRYLSRGGNLNLLKEYAANKSSRRHSVATKDLALITEVIDMFPNRNKLIREVVKFSKRYFKIYTSADLIQRYLKRGGDIRALKDYVRNDCSFSPPSVQSHIQAGGNVIVLQDVGGKIHSDEELRDVLEDFPSDPDVIEAYLRQGGNVENIMKAISSLDGKEGLQNYLWRRVSHVGFRSNGKTKGGRNDVVNVLTPVDGRSTFKGFQPTVRSYEHGLYSKIIALAQAEYYYDKHQVLNELFNNREGDVLSAAISSHRDSLSFSNGNTRFLLPLWLKQKGVTTASVSTATGEKRERLWKPPPAFQIKKSNAPPTKASSPFSHDRNYNLSSLKEDNILAIEKRERTNLSFIKATLAPKVEEEVKPKRLLKKPNKVLPPIRVTTTDENHVKIEPREDVEPSQLQRTRSRQRDKLKKMKRDRVTISSASTRSTNSYASLVVEMPPTNTPENSPEDVPGLENNFISSRSTTSIRQESSESEPTSRPKSIISRNSSVAVNNEALVIVASPIPQTPIDRATRSHSDLRSMYSEALDESDEDEPPKQTKPVIRSQIIFPSKEAREIEKSQTRRQSPPKNKRRKPKTPIQMLKSRRIRGEKISTEKKRSISRPSTTSSYSSTDDLLKRYCIIRKDRMFAYRNLFNAFIEIQTSETVDYPSEDESKTKTITKLQRRKSSFYENLYPDGDPTLQRKYVEEALQELLGARANVDDDVIFETLLKPAVAENVNFHTFCVLAALGETTSENKLPNLKTKTDVGDLDDKITKCQKFYNYMLGKNGDMLSADVKLSGFTDSQCSMVKNKLTDDDNTLSFLDFVTYVPLFVHIHNNVVDNPLLI